MTLRLCFLHYLQLLVMYQQLVHVCILSKDTTVIIPATIWNNVVI